MSIYSYEDAVEFMTGVKSAVIKPGLERIDHLLDLLGHPERDLKIIHVAGTNGKGSVCTFLASIYQEAGLKVGRFDSPQTVSFRDQIQICGKWISEAEVCTYASAIDKVLSNKDPYFDQEPYIEDKPSAFEMLTAMAFMHFSAMKCDIVILETGMGGLLDATNVIKSPLVSVITSVSMDHMNYLGNTLREITFQKCGIIKAGHPAVYLADDQEVESIISSDCDEKGCLKYPVKSDDINVSYASLADGMELDYVPFYGIKTRMPGLYQAVNLALAVKTVVVSDIIQDADILEKAVHTGALKAVWPGRFELISREPDIVIDGAHNIDGIQKLCESVRYYFEGKKIYLLFAVFKDKEHKIMLRLLSGISDDITVYRAFGERGFDTDSLCAEAEEFFENVTKADSQEEAFESVRKRMRPEDVLVCCGSLSTVNGITSLVHHMKSC